MKILRKLKHTMIIIAVSILALIYLLKILSIVFPVIAFVLMLVGVQFKDVKVALAGLFGILVVVKPILILLLPILLVIVLLKKWNKKRFIFISLLGWILVISSCNRTRYPSSLYGCMMRCLLPHYDK